MSRTTDEVHGLVISDVSIEWRKPVRHPMTWSMPADGGWGQMAAFVRKVVAVNTARAERLDAFGQQWRVSHPALWEYMTLEEYEPGQAREVSMLMVFVEDGAFKACLQDRAEGRSLWATSASLEGALEALEAHLKAGTGDWRQMRSHQQGRGKKR